ncbi:hypothetical protein H5410_043822 [Solanum commersonii]|uniref:BACK domain-containing protein n=1 Tax=Solanum commersonii TaxID=4109 RepID=A0A9J5Y1W5_SOLCO|nr:hypothetical protein H5410_043822 [Solanum commersonii]
MNFLLTSNISESQSDYEFAFNDRNYSDRVLMIEIIPNLMELKPESCCIVDDSARKVTFFGYLFHLSNVDDKREEAAIGRLEKLPPNIVMTKSHPLNVRTLFLNDTKSNEEAALMDLLKFIYCNSLSSKTPSGLVDVLMAADKFEVSSCMRYCSNELQNQHMTIETALRYLDLPSKVLNVDAVQPLADAAKLFIILRFRDINKFEKEALSLPLWGIKVVLSSDLLQIASEDAVYDFALKWARMHYHRREVWTTHLCYLIRFPAMTCTKLKKIMTCNDFSRELASKFVVEALFYKAEEPYQQRAIAANALGHRNLERPTNSDLLKLSSLKHLISSLLFTWI